MKRTKNAYFVEVTDTFGGEANYSWVRRYKVESVSKRGAVVKVAKEEGFSFRHAYDISDGSSTSRYNALRACRCLHIGDYDGEEHKFSRVEVL